ncbi:hypothetical protein [Tessaracoccus sp. Y1736]
MADPSAPACAAPADPPVTPWARAAGLRLSGRARTIRCAVVRHLDLVSERPLPATAAVGPLVPLHRDARKRLGGHLPGSAATLPVRGTPVLE